jgi:hypothetical protein
MLNQDAFLKNNDEALSALFLIEYANINFAYHPWYRDIIYYLQYERCLDYLENYEQRRLHLEASKYLILSSLYCVGLLMGYC